MAAERPAVGPVWLSEQIDHVLQGRTGPIRGLQPDRLPNVALGMIHYRIYALDYSAHVAAGYSVECRSDADAMRAAGRLLQRELATAVEVWQGTECNPTAACGAPVDRGP